MNDLGIMPKVSIESVDQEKDTISVASVIKTDTITNADKLSNSFASKSNFNQSKDLFQRVTVSPTRKRKNKIY